MEGIGRPGDDFRQQLSRSDIEQICKRHDLVEPREITPEERGNEKVIYYLDDHLLLAFCLSDDIRANTEALTVLEEVEAMPTPQVIAWLEDDPHLRVPYMIVEKCPGTRLDLLWEKLGHEQRLQLLEALGNDMGYYHTVSLSDVKKVADKLSLSHRVDDAVETSLQMGKMRLQRITENLEHLTVRLGRLGLKASSTVKMLKAHCSQRLSQPVTHFIEPGLIHDDAWAEHFFIERTQDGFRLSGCIDFEEVRVADSLSEIVAQYVSMLALNHDYYDAFKRGYQRFFAFPPDADERLRLAAIDNDAEAILFLLHSVETRPEWSFATPWVRGHLRRLQGWLGESQKIDRAMFRKDIGPW
ncbi:MAG: phosphotransferase [Chloroflexota bacterium]|nr:MAG: phosphotransferase [Chloroflexota bacterium]